MNRKEFGTAEVNSLSSCFIQMPAILTFSNHSARRFDQLEQHTNREHGLPTAGESHPFQIERPSI